MTKLPLPFSVPPVTRSPAVFSTGTGSPVSIDSSTALRPSTTVPSTGILSPGRTRKQVADLDRGERDRLGLAVASARARRLRREVEQRADGAAGALARAQLEHLAEQDQRDDDGGGLEIDRRRGPCASRNAAGNRPGANVATTL